MSSEERKKEGELLKYKSVISGWGKRYFRLERSYLHYFKTKYTHEPSATVTRGEISQVKRSTIFPDKKFAFEIQAKNGVWYCQAKSEEEMLSWIQALSPVSFVAPDPHPIAPCVQLPPVSAPPLPPASSEEPPSYDSPYRALMNEAHHTAFVSNTPHQCVHNSPPPPYNPGFQRQHHYQPHDHLQHLHQDR